MSTILVVDDEFDLLQAVEGVLVDEGYDVIACASGKEALARLADARPALMLLDVMMPYITGYDVVDVVRKNAALAEMPIILMSAAPIRSEARGWQGTLKKPFSLEKLVAVVSSLLGR